MRTVLTPTLELPVPQQPMITITHTDHRLGLHGPLPMTLTIEARAQVVILSIALEVVAMIVQVHLTDLVEVPRVQVIPGQVQRQVGVILLHRLVLLPAWVADRLWEPHEAPLEVPIRPHLRVLLEAIHLRAAPPPWVEEVGVL